MSLPASMLDWGPDALEEYEQRAAARQYLGKMPRARAEAAAEEDVRRWAAAGGDAAVMAALGPLKLKPPR